MAAERLLEKASQHPSRFQKAMETASLELKRVLEPLCVYLGYGSSFLSLLMAGLILIDVVSASLFRSPIQGMLEYETFLLVAYGFLGAGLTTIKDGHVSVEMLASRLSLKSQLFFRGVFPLFGSFLFAVISWQCVTRGIAAHHPAAFRKAAGSRGLPG